LNGYGQILLDPTSWKPAGFEQVSNLLDPVEFGLYLMASCVRNASTKNYQNLVIRPQVTIDNVRDVF